MMNYGFVSAIFSALYVCLIILGKWYMQGRERFVLRTPLVLWSTSLAIFSIFGALRTVPEIVYVLYNYGFHATLEDISFYKGVCGLWTILFTWSKLVELGDTAFIILRKQPLIILHWYHHITVFMYTWFFFYLEPSLGRWFMSMNYSVHSVMYTYYAVRAAGYRLPRVISVVITVLQIAQMFTALGIFFYIYSRRYFLDEKLALDENVVVFGFLMYLSYFVLFVNFFYQSYIKAKPKATPELKSSSGNGHASSHTKNGFDQKREADKKAL